MAIIDSEEKRWTQQKEEAPNSLKILTDKVMTTVNEFDINLTRYLKMSLLEEHAAALVNEGARKKYLRERAREMVATQEKSKLFAPYYLPEEATGFNANSDWVSLYKKFGFYWPTEDDLV